MNQDFGDVVDQDDVARARRQLSGFIEAKGWQAERVGRDSWSLDLQGSTWPLRTLLRIEPAQKLLSVQVQCPTSAASDRRWAAVEYITRVNWSLPIGAMILDPDDGEIRLRVACDFEGDGLSPLRIHNTVGPALYWMNRYVQGLIDVMVDGAEPKRAYHKAHFG